MDTNVCEEHAAYIFRVKFNTTRNRLSYTECKWRVLKTFRRCGAVDVVRDLRQGMCGRKRFLHTQIGVGTSTGTSQKSSNLCDPCGNKDDLELERPTNQNRPGIFEAVRQKVLNCCNSGNGVLGRHFEPFWRIN